MKKIFLVGNPNTGKTTLLNTMACAHEHTGNWHGVTVEEKEKVFEFENQTFSVTDLPGIYSLNSLGFEEELAIKHIFQNPCDIIVNTCDINTLRKNLFLTLDLLLAGKTNLVLVVNTMGQKTASKNFDTLKKALGIEVLCLDFSQKQAVAKLMCYIKNFQPNQTKQNHFKTIFSGKTYENLCLCEKHFGFSKFETIKNKARRDEARRAFMCVMILRLNINQNIRVCKGALR